MDGGMRGRGSRFRSPFGDDMFTSFAETTSGFPSRRIKPIWGRSPLLAPPAPWLHFWSSLGRGGGGSRFRSPFDEDDDDDDDDDVFTSFGYRGGGGPVHQSPGPRKAPSIEYRLRCSLEELYKGTTKKMKISREIADASGKTMPVEEILTIDIKPGWKKGTKITFPEKGNEQPGVIPSDLIFIIDEKPHSMFTRDGNDLVVTEKLPLSEALTCHTVRQNTLDGRTLTIPINNVIHPDHEEVVRGEGMPIPKDPTKKGNLRIKFNVKFPARLNPEQKAGIQKLLTS